MIELESVTKSFSNQGIEYKALNNISLSVDAGDIYGIIGQSGAGKSTLMRCIANLESLSSGNIYIDNVNISNIPLNERLNLSQKMGMIFQSFNLLSQKTVFENVALPFHVSGQTDDLRANVTRLLTRVGMNEFASKYPGTLSGGQKQRVAIARALALKPKVLLCDEATSALDPESTQSVLALLKKLNQEEGITILIITHEMDVIKSICNKVALLSDGNLIESGPVVDVFASSKNLQTRTLLSNRLVDNLPDAFKTRIISEKKEYSETLVQLTYVGSVTSEPLLSVVSKEFSVTVNILLANIESISQQILGQILVSLSGNSNDIDKAISYLQTNQLIVDKVGYVQRTI
ncbi:MAG: DL-methionine transporter ATP-binding subunit [Legionellales bacterium]|nr:DL-methionine transporter ATP-binding subunit [Legionellales bacterium]|tara:strand:- start:428 stop:1468 length:1041 start_codon:yes stop_codon:yes gene_type:complete